MKPDPLRAKSAAEIVEIARRLGAFDVQNILKEIARRGFTNVVWDEPDPLRALTIVVSHIAATSRRESWTSTQILGFLRGTSKALSVRLGKDPGKENKRPMIEFLRTAVDEAWDLDPVLIVALLNARAGSFIEQVFSKEQVFSEPVSLKNRTLTDLTPEERATYDSYIARLATADMQVNQSDFGLRYAEAVAAYDALQGEFENWAEEIGLSQEHL